ncbi:uncharacterized protein LOC114531307 [Dendronephthya gigantea]|uniref:uncharacterized protein LOC114531307 n=1 Tax=Dendronephthya gigantea TaxID=151771 RepID=UPI00106DCAE0|nr:uncharacterized protein LOC114531307 [Dendronephthya gigantea]
MKAAVGDNERRWLIVGICLNKVLTPALREVLGNEIPKWYQSLLPPPHEIDKQTLGRHKKKLPPSSLNLNYESINNNFTKHKSSVRRKYDYAVKDAVSLAKLFVKPFMANFSGFDDTMDTSAALSLVAEAQPFHATGASGMARKVRSDIRNEWAHCNFAHWTDVVYQAALKDMETLINHVNLTPSKRKEMLDDLVDWKGKGLKLCFGEPVDPELLELVHTEVAELKDLVKFVEENTEDILKALEAVEKSLKNEIQELKERQLRTEKDVEQLRAKQDDLQMTISKRNEKEPRYLFMAPKQSDWFSGRKSELGYLRDVLENKSRCGEEGVLVAAISGLGGCGKTSLTAEYIHKWKGYYQGGVYWFSAESDVKFKASVDEIAAQFDTLYNDSFNVTLYKTLAVFSHITKPWLVVVDNMDEADLSPNLVNLVTGPWQENVACFGHLIITTRRTPQDLEEQLSGIEESNCLKLECFGSEEAKEFVFRRTDITRDEQKELSADSLCQKLGGLPLALEQACAYIKYLGCSLSEYLGSYEKQSLQLLNKKKATSFYGTSPERLAVRTTWHLNFEHIKKDENGIVATRFLNASAFLDRNEIQKDLINVGDPLVDDKMYCDYVSSSLGSLEVLKLLTDFLFSRKLTILPSLFIV